MKIALVDDEQNCLDEMARFCRDFGTQNHCLVETVLFRDGRSFLEAFAAGGFSVVFMDICMEGMDGIAAALKMRDQDSGCLLVFLTSSMDYMPEAFSCHAFEYITKPCSPQRVSDVLRDAMKVLPASRKYMKVMSDRKTVPVFFDDIVSVVTDAHYLDIGLVDGTAVRSRMTMTEFMNQVKGESRFIPVNKGISLNADYILDFEGNCCLLKNGAKFPVRVRDRAKIEQAVRDYHFNKIRQHQRRNPLEHT